MPSKSSSKYFNMKKLFTLFAAVLFSINLFAQITPSKKISYQAVVYDKIFRDVRLVDKDIFVRISLLKGIDGPSVYVETHKVKSNLNGLITLQIGGGEKFSGDFNNIKWGQPLFLKTEIDPTIFGQFLELNTITSITELLSVPSANYSDTARASMKSDTAKFALKSDTAHLALKSDTAKFAIKSDTAKFALKSDTAKFALKSDTALKLFGPAWNFVGAYKQINKDDTDFQVEGISIIHYLAADQLGWVFATKPLGVMRCAGGEDEKFWPCLDEEIKNINSTGIFHFKVISPTNIVNTESNLVSGKFDPVTKILTIEYGNPDGENLKLKKL